MIRLNQIPNVQSRVQEVGDMSSGITVAAAYVEDLDELVSRCEAAGYRIVVGEGVKSYRQVYALDPFGNRLELLEFIGE
jgi:catechol 2,3-dioxygenase-like lactoylglutathione lyase family enzyme